MKKTLTKENRKTAKQNAGGLKTIASLLVVLVAATVVLSTLPQKDDEVEIEKALNEPVKVEMAVEPTDLSSQTSSPEENTEKRRRSKLWSLISIPLSVLSTVLWMLLKPIVGKLLSFVFLIAVFFGILLLTLKIINPDITLKDMFTKRNILIVACSSLVFLALMKIPDIALEHMQPGFLYYFISTAGCVLFMILLCDKKYGQQV